MTQKAQKKCKQLGLSMIELLISLVIGLIVIAGVISVFVSTLTGSRDLLEQARLEHELNTILLYMSDDIRRAGFWGDEALDADYANDDRNPFTEGIHMLSISEITSGATDSCILYTYNLDGDGNADADADDARIGFCSSCAASSPFNNTATYDQGNMEMFGYRLSGAVVQMRTGASSGDTTYTCDSGEWEDLSDSRVIDITTLSFSPTSSAITTLTVTDDSGNDTDLQIETWQVDISLTGELQNDSTVTKTLNTSVRLGNDIIQELP